MTAFRHSVGSQLSAVSRNINLILPFPGNNGPPRPLPLPFSRCTVLLSWSSSTCLHQGRKLHRSESWEAGRRGFCRAIIAPWSTCPLTGIIGHVAYPPERGFCPVMRRVFRSWCGVKRDGVIHPVSLLLTAMSHGGSITIGAYGQSSWT